MSEAPRIFRFGEHELDQHTFELRKAGARLELQPKPLRLLFYLVQNRKRVVDKQELFDQVWPDASVSESALTSALRDLRRALDDDGKVPGTIETLRGRGYRFIAPVAEVSVECGETLDADRSRWQWPLGIAATAIAAALIAGWWIARPERPLFPGLPEQIRSVAVLPLENLSGDSEQEYFADGMTGALIVDLAKIGSLRVISQTSVMQYKQERKPLPEIAAELGVDAILVGAVMPAGDRVRITTQLIDGRTDTQLWSESYERELSEVLLLQSEVARAVARALDIKLTAAEMVALNVQRTVDPRAYESYMRGMEALIRFDLFRQSLEHFERAALLDPDFAEAFIIIGVLGVFAGDLPKAREAAQRALELDESSGPAHAALGFARMRVDWDFAGAERAFERALELAPNHFGVLTWYANYLIMVGRCAEGLALSDRAASLLPPLSLGIRSERIHMLARCRRYDRAVEEIGRIREVWPDVALQEVAIAYWFMGRHEEAHREYTAFWERSGPGFEWLREARLRGWAQGGWEGARRAITAELVRRGQYPFDIAQFYAELGDTEEAFAWLERAYREHDRMEFLKSQPTFDPLRSDPRFDELLRRIGFPET